MLYYEKFPARYIAYEISDSLRGYQEIVSQACKDKFTTYLDLSIDSMWAQQGNDGASELAITLF